MLTSSTMPLATMQRGHDKNEFQVSKAFDASMWHGSKSTDLELHGCGEVRDHGGTVRGSPQDQAAALP
jgi:hypothetical protein